MPGRGEIHAVDPSRPPPVLRPVDPLRGPPELCLHCRCLAYMVKVAGHIQCSRCTQVAEPCCEGVTMAKSAEIGAKF